MNPHHRLTTGGIDRRRFLGLLGATGVVAGAGGLLAACGDAGTGPDTAGDPGTTPAAQLRVGYLPITDATPLLVAHAQGYYEDEGLSVPDPTLFRGWPDIAEAFQARQIDVMHVLMPLGVQLRFDQGVAGRIVAWNHTNGSALTVAPGIETVEDLAGTTVAIPFFYSIHNVALQILLRESGLRPVIDGDASAAERTVKLVVMPPPDMPPALAGGSIAGYIVADPFNAAAEVQEVGRILRFTGDLWRDHACCVVMVRDELVEDQPASVQSLVNAVVTAQAFARDNLTEVASILAEGYLPQPLPAIERALTYYDVEHYGPTGAIRHPEWGSRRIGFAPFPFPSYTEELVRRMQETEVAGDRTFLDELVPAEVHGELVEDRFVRAALEVVGTDTFGLPGDLTRTETIEV